MEHAHSNVVMGQEHSHVSQQYLAKPKKSIPNWLLNEVVCLKQKLLQIWPMMRAIALYTGYLGRPAFSCHPMGNFRQLPGTKACLNGHLEVVKALVATRANPNVYNDFRKRCSCAADGAKLKIGDLSGYKDFMQWWIMLRDCIQKILGVVVKHTQSHPHTHILDNAFIHCVYF